MIHRQMDGKIEARVRERYFQFPHFANSDIVIDGQMIKFDQMASHRNTVTPLNVVPGSVRPLQ